MPPIFSEIPPSNGGYLLLVWTVVVGSGGVDASFWAGEDFEMLFLSFSSSKTWLSVSVICLMFSVVSLWFLSAYCLMASILASMARNWSSDLVSILLPPFGILKLGVGRVVINGADGRECANNLVKSVCSARDSG